MKSDKLMAMLTSTLLSASAAFAAPHNKDAGAAGAVPKDYPLKKCVVSDEALGEHGKPVKVTAKDGTDVYLCCKDCKKDFDKDPAKYAKIVKDAKGKK
jgi:hypothetical protein